MQANHTEAPEEWREIQGFPDYSISSHGRVISRRRGVPRVMNPTPVTGGYLHVRLFSREGRSATRRVHSLVIEAFIGPRPDGLQVRHLDGDQKNNRAENLAYGTASENARDMVRHGTHNYASRDACKNGHPFDEENTRQTPRQRRCLACEREKCRRQRAKQNAQQQGVAA